MATGSDPPDSHAPRKAGDPLHVLIVDDDQDTALGLKAAVEDFGDLADTAFSGAGAIAMTEAADPDVVLLDLTLPDSSGFAVAKTLRAGRRSKILKIIAVTGLGDEQSKRQTAAAGFDLHLTKPVRLAVLEAMLDLLRSAPVTA